jgi:CBS domain-containing protein
VGAFERDSFVLCGILSYAVVASGLRRTREYEVAMNIEGILRTKGRTVATIAPDATVGAAVDELISRNIGALVVSQDGKSVDGIISERDIVHALAERGADLLSLKVAQVMTRRVVTCDPADSIEQLMAEMTNRRIRHFPVVQDGRLCGIVSIGDAVKNRLDEVEYEARSLRSFIAGA